MTTIFEEILGRTDGLERPFILGDQPASYGDLVSLAERVATVLREAGCQEGDRVGVCLDQGLSYVASLLGVWRAGGVSVLMTPDWTDTEKDRVLGHAGVAFALADVPFLGSAEPLATREVSGSDAVLLTFPRPGALGDTALDRPAPGDAVLIYTSGTTGTPKGVMLPADSVSANVRAVATYLELGADDASPVFTPPCYAYSLSLNLTHAAAGAAIHPVASGLMFPIEIAQAVSQHRMTGIAATPTAFRMLCQVDADGLDLSSVRYVMTGGQFLDLSLVGAMTEFFPKSRVVNMYGCSENAPRIAYHHVDGRRGMDDGGYFAVGRPVAGTELRIVGDDGAPVAPGQTGQVHIRGTSLMRGYWRDPEATEARMRDGWFNTRDLGHVDAEELLHLTGRKSSVINIGNEKVSPEEVEKVLAEVPGVVEAGVYGVSDALLGEAVHAQVVVSDGARVPTQDLQRHCRRKVSGYKVPRRIHIVDELPKTHYGKIDRSRLRDPA